MATSLLVGTCLASFTLAKLPLPIVFSSLYLPMCSSPDLHRAVVPRICIFGEPRLVDERIDLVPAELLCEWDFGSIWAAHWTGVPLLVMWSAGSVSGTVCSVQFASWPTW
uniref:Putative secreted protein n=1 Tax=Anopheles darlingi TaxID=43151 RepID=A0A2M4D6C8_ANODA